LGRIEKNGTEGRRPRLRSYYDPEEQVGRNDGEGIVRLSRAKRKAFVALLSESSNASGRNRQKRSRFAPAFKPPPPVTEQHPIVRWYSTVDVVEEEHRRRLRAALKAAGRIS
jgi:hypothetical protein